jgi:hypothetical protein
MNMHLNEYIPLSVVEQFKEQNVFYRYVVFQPRNAKFASF